VYISEYYHSRLLVILCVLILTLVYCVLCTVKHDWHSVNSRHRCKVNKHLGYESILYWRGGSLWTSRNLRLRRAKDLRSTAKYLPPPTVVEGCIFVISNLTSPQDENPCKWLTESHNGSSRPEVNNAREWSFHHEVYVMER